ncbi:MAG: BatA domain-containing protein [Alphaproteobacteria bacterium]
MPLVFELPWLLLALAGLPALWWLLRVTPPPLRRINFPAVRLLVGLRDSEDKPHRIPIWLLILRILAAALLIIGLAGPRFEPEPLLSGDGVLLLVVDNGWSAAPVWQDFVAEWEVIIRAAQRQGRAVHILPTARLEGPAATPALSSAGEALRQLERLRPVSWPSDYVYATRRLRGLDQSMDEIVFLSDGLGGREARRFVIDLRRLGDVSLRVPELSRRARLLQPPVIRADSLHLSLVAARGAVSELGAESLRMRGTDGELLASEQTGEYDESGFAEVRLRLPRRVLDRLVSVETVAFESAGGVQLLAEGDRLRRILLWLPPSEINEPQPLLSSAHYLTRALSLFSEVKRGKLDFLDSFSPDIIVTDGESSLTVAEVEKLSRWVESGGILLRFAGDGLLSESAGSLLPVRLRPAVRSLGGSLSWEEPVSISPELPENSPLVGLAIPGDEEGFFGVSELCGGQDFEVTECGFDLIFELWRHYLRL